MNKKILFVCVGNSARSQMAEGYMKDFSKGEFEVFSAGVIPTPIHPLAIQVMDEDGIDISQQHPKDISIFQGSDFDYVITLCDDVKQVCPEFPAKTKKLHWSIEDPVGYEAEEKQQLAFFRVIRNEIKNRVEEFLKMGK